MKFNLRNYLMDIPTVLFGNLCIAVAVVCFVIPNKILVGGTAGVAVVINAFTGIDEQIMIKILTYALFLVGAVILGRSFTIKTIVSAAVYPFLLSLVNRLYPLLPAALLEVDTLIATVCSGVLVGLGIGLVYRRNASTGGMDILPLIINKYTHLPLSALVMAVDGATVLLGTIAYGLSAAVYGVISVWVCTLVINKTMLMGTQKLKQVHVISPHSGAIIDEITSVLDRGCTIIDAKGGYTKEKRNMLMTVVTIKQYPALIEVIHSIDASAFVIVSDINEVKGRGFTLESEYL